MVGSKINRMQGKRGEKTREAGERAREPPFCLFSLLFVFFFPRQLFARALLSEHLEQANAH